MKDSPYAIPEDNIHFASYKQTPNIKNKSNFSNNIRIAEPLMKLTIPQNIYSKLEKSSTAYFKKSNDTNSVKKRFESALNFKISEHDLSIPHNEQKNLNLINDALIEPYKHNYITNSNEPNNDEIIKSKFSNNNDNQPES